MILKAAKSLSQVMQGSRNSLLNTGAAPNLKLAINIFPNTSLTAVKFPDISRFSTQVVTLIPVLDSLIMTYNYGVVHDFHYGLPKPTQNITSG